MNQQIEDHIVDQVRALYLEDDLAQKLFDWAASRTHDAAQTSIDRMASKIQASRPEAIRLARKLDELGCGQFVQGRKGWKSRMKWSYSVKSLGAAAQGHVRNLEEVDLELAQDAEDQQQIAAAATFSFEELDEGHFTIAEAKRRLAENLGIDPDAIEITIRA
jgi:DNA-binding MurR/RpiR family transcriptional regulator